MQETYNITGMTCSACSARIEKNLKPMAGVEDITVNLLKNTMQIKYQPELISQATIMATVIDLGYGISLNQSDAKNIAPSIAANDPFAHKKAMQIKLVFSLIFTIPLFYISMGEMMNWPLPGFLTASGTAMVFALSQLLLTFAVVIINQNYFKIGFSNLFKRAPNMDSLIAVGAGAALVYSIYATYKIAWGSGHNDLELISQFTDSLYYESAAMILSLITLGKFLEAGAKGKTTEAINKLLALVPAKALVIRDGQELEIDSSQLVLDDIIIIKEGFAIPTDGQVIKGHAAIDESAISGESLPVEKNIDDKVIGGTINKNGYLQVRVTAVGKDTALAQIIDLIDQATSSKAPIAKLADKISSYFVPIVMTIAALAAIIWLVLGYDPEFALSIGIAVLVISCPCALGLATPTAIMVGTGRGAGQGILIKSAEALETAHSIDTVVIDKTGTITEGRPIISDIVVNRHNPNLNQQSLLQLAASLENNSGHPLAEPIVAAALNQQIALLEMDNYQLIPGQGIVADYDSQKIYGGNAKLMAAAAIDISAYTKLAEDLATEGKTALYFAQGQQFLGLIAVSDRIKPNSALAIEQLKALGLTTIMLTGDNRRTAEAIRSQLSLDEVIAEVLPADKEREIRRLQEAGHRVAMVGDGINDAPALVSADIGLAIGAGTDIAIEAADIVLIKSDLLAVPQAIQLSKAVMRNIKQNLFWAFFYNIMGIPLAAGLYYLSFDWLLNPMFAAAAMSLSSVCVVSNALRLRFFKPQAIRLNQAAVLNSTPASTINIIDNQEELTMQKTIKIEGMSCNHCVKAVTKALTAIEGVVDVAVSLEEKQAIVKLSHDIDQAILVKAIEDEDFEVVGIG